MNTPTFAAARRFGNQSPAASAAQDSDVSVADAIADGIVGSPSRRSDPAELATLRDRRSGGRGLGGTAAERGGRRPQISLVIPALNETAGLAAVLPRVPDLVDEVIVVDGGSTDGTASVVSRVCPRAILLTQEGRGKGDALKCGLAAARGDIIVTMDADGSMNPEDIGSFVQKLLEGNDFVKGSRSLPDAGSRDFTLLRRAGNSGLTSLANLIFGSQYTDITFGFNAYWRSAGRRLGLLADGFEFEIQAALRAASLGMRTAEVPTFEPARIGGQSKLNPMTDGWAILRIILSEASPRRGPRFGASLSALGMGAIELVPEQSWQWDFASDGPEAIRGLERALLSGSSDGRGL